MLAESDGLVKLQMKYHVDYRGRLWESTRSTYHLVDDSPLLKPSKLSRRYHLFITINGELYDPYQNSIIESNLIFTDIIPYLNGIHLLLDSNGNVYARTDEDEMIPIAENAQSISIIHRHDCWGTDDYNSGEDDKYSARERDAILVINGDSWRILDMNYHPIYNGTHDVGEVIDVTGRIVKTSVGWYFLYYRDDDLTLFSVNAPDNTVTVIDSLADGYHYGIMVLTSDGRLYEASPEARIFLGIWMSSESLNEDHQFVELDNSQVIESNRQCGFIDLFRIGSNYYLINRSGAVYKLSRAGRLSIATRYPIGMLYDNSLMMKSSKNRVNG